MAEPLRLIDTVKLTFDQVWESRAAMSLIVVIAAAVKATSTWIAYNFMEPLHAALLHKAIGLLVYTVLAISVHRLLLNAEQPFMRYWRMREIRFLGWLLIIYGCFKLIFVGFGIVFFLMSGKPFELFGSSLTGSLVFLLMSMPAAYICARFSLLLPAIALDRKSNLAWAWALTKGSGLKLATLLWVLPFVFSLLYSGWQTESPVMYLALNLVLSTLTAFEVALLSVAFKALDGMSFKTQPEVQTQPL